MAGRSRGFIFTLNNWTYDEKEKLSKYLEKNTGNKKKIDKYIFGEERGKIMGTPHLQGYIYYNNARAQSIVEKEIDLINRIWMQKAKGTPKHNYVYCKKECHFILGGDWDKIIQEVCEEEEGDELALRRRTEYIAEMTEQYDRAVNMRDMILRWVNPEYKNMGWDSGYDTDDECDFLDCKQFMN